MGILDKKKEIFGNIGAINVLNDNFPKLPSTNSLPSINNGLNSTQFLMDLITSLVGFDALKDYVTNTITYKLSDIEDEIKSAIKTEFKEIVSCSINPSMPSWFKNDGDGVILKVMDVDFFDTMKVNPDSLEGNLIFTDITSGVNSSDFNTYLYNTIQSPTVDTNWGISTYNKEILQTTFLETHTSDNNVLKFNATVDYSSKKLTQFNNDYIDSISLFGSTGSLNSKTFINSMMEEMFGTISSSSGVKKSKKQLKKEGELREVLDCIINSENDLIDDSYFTFDNPTIAKIDEDVNNRKNGIRRLETCGNLVVKITSDELSVSQDLIDSSTTTEEEFNSVSTALDNLSDIQSSFSQDPKDKLTVKSDFFSEMIKKFSRVIMNIVLSPKVITLFAINHQIIYGQGSKYDGPVDFLKKNKKIIKGISKRVSQILLNLLLTLALKYLTIKLAQKISGDEIEKNKNYVKVVLSYLGVPSSISDQISKL
tara:strand:+ start:2708 stop:4153 length:1446 start_codon:yes stop_codon:yes gene_type:complete